MPINEQGRTILQVLSFLATIGVVGIGVLATVAFAIAARPRIARLTMGFTLAAVAAYGVALVSAGALSREHVLGPSESKVFCEIDCHLAYSVPRTRLTPTIGGARARGTFYVVSVRTYFDEHTIAPWRGDGQLWPNPRRVRVVDSTGHRWAPDAAAQHALETNGAAGTPIETPLRPGESYETTYVFDLPTGVVAPRLELTEADAVTRVLVGHENSPFHRKTLFALGRGFASGGGER
jgi:hypothetical protein